MFSLLLGIAIGLIIGWNFLPQPEWAKSAVEKVKDFIGLKSAE